MPRLATRAHPGRDRASLYTEITGKIIAELEAGRVPWVQPWGGPDVCAGLGLPQNAATRRRYSGINILILWGAVTGRGYSSQNWLTFRQALGLGGKANSIVGGTGVIDHFLEVFTRYIDSGFGLLGDEVAFLATTLIVIDVTLAALFWSWDGGDDILARLVKKTLFVGVFAYPCSPFLTPSTKACRFPQSRPW